jgi:XTP/dITP diphosphohydrolase
MRLIFATNNENKIAEIRPLVGDHFELQTLQQAGIDQDIPEPFDTLEENASEKSRVIYSLSGCNCFSEDTGLEVNSLNGEPGVKSARYAGENRSSDENIDRLLINLAEKQDRSAQFRTVISLIVDGKEFLFEGICTGQITKGRTGVGGFGYDPVFIPDGSNKTFAEMSLKEKSEYSHRAKATAKLVAFLNNMKTNH